MRGLIRQRFAPICKQDPGWIEIIQLLILNKWYDQVGKMLNRFCDSFFKNQLSSQVMTVSVKINHSTLLFRRRGERRACDRVPPAGSDWVWSVSPVTCSLTPNDRLRGAGGGGGGVGVSLGGAMRQVKGTPYFTDCIIQWPQLSSCRDVSFQIFVWFQKILLQNIWKCFLKFHIYNPF